MDQVPTPATLPRLFKTREGELFFEFYRALQDTTGRLVPPREAFDPRAARAFLPHMMILEIKDPATIIARLVGTVIVSRTGMDQTGKNLIELAPPEGRGMMWQHYRRLLDTPCGACMLVTEDYENKNIALEHIDLPLADKKGEPRLIASLSIEIDRQDLAMRGKSKNRFGSVLGFQLLDIGAGT